jgi:hypothetical protein
MNGKGTVYWTDGSFCVGEFQHEIKFGFGTLSSVLNNPYNKEFADSGKWIGNYFVVEGVFADDGLIASCPSDVDCIKKLTLVIQIDGGKKVKMTN